MIAFNVTPGAALRFGANFRVYDLENGGRLVLKKLADKDFGDIPAEKMVPHIAAAQMILNDPHRGMLSRLESLRARMNAIPGFEYDSYHIH